MPRKGFGPRPVTIVSPLIRTLYNALSDFLFDAVGSERRSRESWREHDAFGVPKDSSEEEFYLVDVDIASCYEYIDHESLASQIAMHTSQIEVVKSLTDLLHEIMGKPRGLPQMSSQSDALADIYLGSLEREIVRRGYRASRMADDFKIIAKSWTDANNVIEAAAESARAMGLVLSTEKTNIRRSPTVLGSSQKEAQFLNEHFDMARTPTVSLIWNPYEDPETFEVTPDDEEVIRRAFWFIVREWVEKSPEDTSMHASYLGIALTLLRTHVERLENDSLTEIVFRIPLRLESVCRYILGRPEEVEENWQSLEALTSMGRQSAWAKIWLLNTGNRLHRPKNGSPRWFTEWAAQQISDRHEVVRSEAAWVLSGLRQITAQNLSDLYSSATSLTRPAIAAAVGRSKAPEKSQLVQAIVRESSLTKPAYQWGARHGSQ